MVVALAVLLLAGGCGAGWLALRPGARSERPVPLGAAFDPPEPAQAVVFVSGAVEHPGLYRVSTGARLSDALAAAGGLGPDADLGRLPDLAGRVHDGKQVNIPFTRSSARGGGAAPGGRPRVDVNTASVDELRAVAGMPLGLPEAIVEARSTFGPFGSLAQVKALLGLDTPTWAGLRTELRAGTVTR